MFPVCLQRHSAWIGGILLPLLESIRRWGTGNYLLWVDDYLIARLCCSRPGALTAKVFGPALARRGWGLACESDCRACLALDANERADVSGFDHRLLTGAIGAGLLLALVALLAPQAPPAGVTRVFRPPPPPPGIWREAHPSRRPFRSRNRRGPPLPYRRTARGRDARTRRWCDRRPG